LAGGIVFEALGECIEGLHQGVVRVVLVQAMHVWDFAPLCGYEYVHLETLFAAKRMALEVDQARTDVAIHAIEVTGMALDRTA